MRITGIFIVFVVVLLLNSTLVNAQFNSRGTGVRFRLPTIALVDIEPSFDNNIHFNVIAATESGESPKIEKDSGEDLWINYTSSARGNSTWRTIVAEIAGGELPDGISFYLEASECKGNGKGNRGSPTGKILLSENPQAIISGIGNCFTGNGINNGHELNFTVEMSDYKVISAVNVKSFTVMYTISDN